MIIKTAELVAVGVKKSQYPEDNMAEVAFCGRSNVGKSSLINFLLNRKKLARTSSSPGKTRTVNFYQINDQFRIVDLPGYGYAKVSKSLSENWGEMIENYLKDRQGLRKAFLLVDIRHEPTEKDVIMYQWLRHYGMDGFVVATKADKISKNEMMKSIALIRKTLKLGLEDRVLPISTLNKTGFDQLMESIDQIVTTPVEI